MADVAAKVLNCGHGLVANLVTAGNCEQMWPQLQLQGPGKLFCCSEIMVVLRLW